MVADAKECGEGVSFFGVRRLILADVPGTAEDMLQRVGRAVRFMGHAALPEADRDVDVRLYVATLKGGTTVDEVLVERLRSDLGKYGPELGKLQAKAFDVGMWEGDEADEGDEGDAEACGECVAGGGDAALSESDDEPPPPPPEDLEPETPRPAPKPRKPRKAPASKGEAEVEESPPASPLEQPEADAEVDVSGVEAAFGSLKVDAEGVQTGDKENAVQKGPAKSVAPTPAVAAPPKPKAGGPQKRAARHRRAAPPRRSAW